LDLEKRTLLEIRKLDRKPKKSQLPNLQRERSSDRIESWIEKSVTQISNVRISLPDQISDFYGSSEFTFESCGMDGMFGPDLAKCISFYNVEWVKNDNYFSMPKIGIQKVKIPIYAEFEFTAFGAGWKWR